MFKIFLFIFVLSFTSIASAADTEVTIVDHKNASIDSNASESRSFGDKPGGYRIIQEGQPAVSIHATKEAMDLYRKNEAKKSVSNTIAAATTTNNLKYFGGLGGIGVQTAPKVYLIIWGSQWIGNDPSSEVSTLINFFNGIGGSSWLNSVTQYCQGVANGTTFCNGAGSPAGNQKGMLAGVWYDTGVTAPTNPTQLDLALETVRAVNYFGNTSSSAQYVIATAHNNNSAGFGSQYCAWHSWVGTNVGNIAYVNFPYITDAGGSCGANFNGLGSKAGISIVAGHELAETITDPFPALGWTDSNGAENADKCDWIPTGVQGAAAKVTLSTGSFPVASLWSNKYGSSKGGCVRSY